MLPAAPRDVPRGGVACSGGDPASPREEDAPQPASGSRGFAACWEALLVINLRKLFSGTVQSKCDECSALGLKLHCVSAYFILRSINSDKKSE